MKKLIFLLATIFFIACSDSKDCCTPNSTAMDLQIIIEVINSNEENMFNPATNDNFDVENVRFYKSIGDNTTLVYNGNWDYPYGYRTDSNSNGDILIQTTGLFPEPNSSYAEFVIEMSNTNQYTIKCEVEQLTNVLRFSKVWVNNVLQWENTSQTERKATIIVVE